jgi:hypothetical protein
VLNGQVLPGETDSYSFHAVRGELLVFVAQARDLIPYLADAVPGWFEPVLTILNVEGVPVADAQSFRFAPDPVLAFDVKETGDYTLQIRDAIYRGREDFVYRITAGKIPFVTGIFPLGGRLGSRVDLAVDGWNLPVRRMPVDVSAEGIQRLPRLANGFATMDVSFAGDNLPEMLAPGPGKSATLPLPVVVNGRIEVPGQVAEFAVCGKKGEPLVAEVLARRLNSPLDSFLRVTGPDGKAVAENDDFNDKENGLLTHHADSRVEFTPTADGIYRIRLSDAQRQGGPPYAYRLLVGPPRPDFALRIVPSGITGFPGATVPMTVFALRKDGFSGPIDLFAEPEGFVLSGGRIPAGQNSVTVTLTFPKEMGREPQRIGIRGTAVLAGKKLSRQAVPADDELQAFIYHQLVPDGELLAFALPGREYKNPLQWAQDHIRITPGSPAKAKILLAKNGGAGNLRATIQKPPDGLSIVGVKQVPDGVEVAFQADPEKLKPGQMGNLIVELTAGRAAKQEEKDKREKRWSLGILPAISCELADKAASPLP